MGFLPIGFLKKTSGGLGNMFNQLLAVFLSLLFAGMHQLKDEGLQEKNRRYIGKRVIAHDVL